MKKHNAVYVEDTKHLLTQEQIGLLGDISSDVGHVNTEVIEDMIGDPDWYEGVEEEEYELAKQTLTILKGNKIGVVLF
jgi:hypothetical protein